VAEARPQETIYQQLTKAAQRLARAFGERATGAEGSPQPSSTEVAALKERFEAAEEALAVDIVPLARRVVEDAGAQRVQFAKRLHLLQAERRDVDRRRSELAECAKEYDWGISHTEKRDYVGPFSIEYTPESATLELGKSKRCKLAFPTGMEVFEAVKAERAELERLVEDVWTEMKKRIVPRQATPDTLVAWPDVVAALSTPEVPFRKREAVVLYALALLRAGKMRDGWSASFKPPTLAQQNDRDAVTLPRIDRPGNPDRIAALRLNAPERAG
jgi:hypothetical protein